MHEHEEIKNLSLNIFELKFNQDLNKCKDNLIPNEISKDESDRIVELVFFENHYALIKKLRVFSGNLFQKFICRRCLYSYTNENTLVN